MYKELLVHVKSHEEWSSHIDLAFGLAQRFKARLTGVLAHENLAIAKLLSGGPGGGGAVLPTLQAAADQVTAQMTERFGAKLQATGVEGELQIAEGRADEVLTLAGRFQDLVIVEQTDLRYDDINWSTAEEAAVNSGRPTLIAPRQKPADPAFRRVLIAWNGGREATSALHAARPIWQGADDVVLLAGPTRELMSSVVRPPPGGIEAYLRRHCRAVQVADSTVRDHDAAARILDVATTMACDIIVMGAFGRKGFSRLILGGATGRVFREAQVPILAAH